jgi:Methyltransferase domain
MTSGEQAREALKYRLITAVYRAVPPLRYWGVRRGYLMRIGWVRSNWARTPVDASGDPLPWLTYPAIDFLHGRIQPSMKVFEYGSGQSTRWWARHVESVHAIEDDSEWFERVSADLPSNVDLRFADSSGDDYARSIGERGEVFDVVVIDGSARNDCARECVAFLAPDGVIVWDNTEEPNIFGEGLEFLSRNGFRRIDFHGMTPLNMDPHATSVLYRPGQNSFEI